MKNTTWSPIALGLLSLSLNVQATPVWLTMSSAVLHGIQQNLPQNAIILDQKHDTTMIKVEDRDVLKISGTIHHQLKRCGGFSAHANAVEAKSALNGFAFWNRQKNLEFDSYEVSQQDLLDPMIDGVSEERIRQTILSLSKYKNRDHKSQSGIQSSLSIKDQWENLVKNRSDISLEVYEHKNFPQPSIILTVQGSSAADEIVILGAHADSISNGRTAPGADDNASGVAAVTEVIRQIVTHDLRPARTVKFIAYAAEEVGLLGSQEIAKSFKAQRKNVVGVLQLDMTLFKGTMDKDIHLISDYTNRKQNEFLGKLIDEYVKVPWGYSECGYGCSDHASWTAQGYPASFPFEAAFDDHNPHIHTEGDTLENAGGTAEHAVSFAKLALAFVTELSF
jgi:bacterial leucyl aminopeptidase